MEEKKMNCIKNIQDKITELKKERDFCILSHCYQTHDIIEIADFVGDSFALSKYAANTKEKNILMCGVRFMAETAKILSPDKRVFLSHPDAGCPMAEQFTKEQIKQFKQSHPLSAVVAYINTTAEIKCECDVCVTSASALEIVKKLPQNEILFIPDCNLGSWIQKQVPEKKFHFINGGCPVHMRITVEDVVKEKAKHPNALLLVHPECISEVTELSDYAGSTTGIMNYVKNSNANEFIIGTDNVIASHLEFEYPDKKFYVLSKRCVCDDMRLTTINNVLGCLEGNFGEEIILPDDVLIASKRSIDTMLAI